jgi:hypothetical protein
MSAGAISLAAETTSNKCCSEVSFLVSFNHQPKNDSMLSLNHQPKKDSMHSIFNYILGWACLCREHLPFFAN